MPLPGISRILLVRADGIGDLLNSTPAIRWLRQSYPQARLTCLVTPLGAPLLEGNPDVDDVWIAATSTWRERGKLMRALRRKRFDLAVSLQTSSWCHFVVVASGARYRVGRHQKHFRRWLTHPDGTTYRKGEVHEVQRNLNLVRSLCEGEPPSALVLQMAPSELAQAQALLEKHGIRTAEPFILIHPGGSSFDKLWPPEYFAEIAGRLRQQAAQVAVVHGPGELELAEAIAAPHQLPILTPGSLRELAALTQHARLMVCNDSGPMHIAAALQTPTVAIFGPTDHVRWGPPNAYKVRRDMPCWPCSAHKCQIGFECVKQLPVERVWTQIQAALRLPRHASLC